MIFEHDLTKVRLADLHFDKSNPNQLTQEQMKGLRLSMERFGYLTPIVVDQNNLIADGEHRALIYKEFGLQEIPAYRVTFSDDTERRLLRQTMNKLRGQHDYQLDADEMALIYESNKLPDLAGLIAQQEATIKELMLKYRPELPFGHKDDEQIDQLIDEQLKRTAPDTQLGDIYQLGNHRLICADCTDKRSVDRLFDGNKADLLFTDPPYNLGYQSGTWSKQRKEKLGRIENDSMEDSEFIEWLILNLNLIDEYIEPTSDRYICTDWKVYHLFYEAIKKTGQRISNLIIWNKLYQTQALNKFANAHEFIIFIGDNSHPYKDINVWDCKREFHPDHPTPKPVEIVAKALRYSNGKTVYDPFLGSGSTMIACEQTGRYCYGVEIDPHYCDVICRRWEAYTGQKAIKLS